MSQIMEKTLASLPKLLTQGLIGGKSAKPTNHQLPSQDVQNFMKLVHRAKSKSHEAAIVQAELADSQEKLKQVDLTASSWLVRNSFTKALFCHLLGYNITFIAIHALKLGNQGRGYDRRLGYLMSCLILHRHHEMVLLMMGTLLRDLKSSNIGDNCIALLVAGELVGEETIPYILPEVIPKLSHNHELVREKALHCFRAFYQCAPALLQPSLSKLNVSLTNRDPGSLNAAVNIFLILVNENPAKYTGLAHSFLHILQQINQRGFGTNYYYHMVPLPWLQISLLKILGCLGAVDLHISEQTAPVLQNLIEKTKVTEPISLAILVESVSTATKIHANEQLLQLCSRCIGKLLSSDASNGMKYQGLGLLISLSRVKSSYAAQHQMAVIECLSDEDTAIQVRTTQLLHAMANRANVKAICGRLFDQTQKTHDKVFMNDILQMISDVAERLMIDIDWYINTYLSLLELSVEWNVRQAFMNQVLERVELLSRKIEAVSEESIDNLTTTLLQVLNKKESTQPVIMLSLQILGVLAPIISNKLPEALFLTTAERFFISAEMQNSALKQTIIIRPPANPKKGHEYNDKDELSSLQCSCLDTVLKLVLAGCLNVVSVKEWLDKVKVQQIIKDASIYRALDELEEIIHYPEDLTARFEIMFQPEKSGIDYSLSFLDSLIVSRLLQGQEVSKPAYVILAENAASLSPIKTPDEENQKADLDTTTTTLGAAKRSSSESSKLSKSFMKIKNKWREDEDDDGEEKFFIVDANGDEELEKQEERKKKEGMMELFAGLDDDDHKKPVRNSPKTKKSFKSLWDDDEDSTENKLTIGSSLGLHPFGIPKKTRNNQQSSWFDEDFENDNLSSSLDANVESGFISSQSEKAESPAGFNSSLYGDYDITGLPITNNNMSNSPLYNTLGLKGDNVASVGTRFQPSIYSDNLGEVSTPTGTASSGAMSVSTIDALTDSEPDDDAQN